LRINMITHIIYLSICLILLIFYCLFVLKT